MDVMGTNDQSPLLKFAAAGVLSLGFGLFLVYQIGFVEGLFTR